MGHFSASQPPPRLYCQCLPPSSSLVFTCGVRLTTPLESSFLLLPLWIIGAAAIQAGERQAQSLVSPPGQPRTPEASLPRHPLHAQQCLPLFTRHPLAHLNHRPMPSMSFLGAEGMASIVSKISLKSALGSCMPPDCREGGRQPAGAGRVQLRTRAVHLAGNGTLQRGSRLLAQTLVVGGEQRSRPPIPQRTAAPPATPQAPPQAPTYTAYLGGDAADGRQATAHAIHGAPQDALLVQAQLQAAKAGRQGMFTGGAAAGSQGRQGMFTGGAAQATGLMPR